VQPRLDAALPRAGYVSFRSEAARDVLGLLTGMSSAEESPDRCRALEALGFGDGDVVDPGLAAAHEAVLVELPLLVAVPAFPGVLSATGRMISTGCASL
jgi:hypothetical protein